MYKYSLAFVMLIWMTGPSVALNDSKSFNFAKLSFNQFRSKFKDEKTTKISQDITLKINKDLFTKGVVLKAKSYGKYFANLDVSNLLDLKFPAMAQDKFSSFQKRNSVVTGGLRVGHIVTNESRLFLRIGFESQNLTKGALKTPHLTTSSQSYWKTDLDSGVGIEHAFARNFFLTGEVRTNLSSNFTHLSEAPAVRRGVLKLGLKYFFGEK